MSTRDRILDAAYEVLRSAGLARATTKAIAAAAGCSEALLYKHFGDKQEIFLAVLAERMPRPDLGDTLVGVGTVPGNLQAITRELLGFYVRSFPIAASIFGSADLLQAHRTAMAARGVGPTAPARAVQRYLDAEVGAGRLRAGTDTEVLARMLAGAALFEGFLAAYDGRSEVPDVEAIAARIVAAVLTG